MPWLSWILSNVVLASVLALAAWFVQRRMRRPALAHLLWVLVLVKLVTPPLVSLPAGESRGATACELGVCGCPQHARVQSILPEKLPLAFLGAWLTGAGATSWTAWRRWSRFRQLLAHAAPAPAEWQLRGVRLSSELGLRRPPEILAVPGRLPPLVVAGWRLPRVLLPADLIDRLPDSQRDALLLHELVHLRRHDHLVRLLELTVRIACWWLPGIGAVGRALRECEEACCDAAVVAHRPRARRDYAGLLLDVVDFTNPLPRQSLSHVTAMTTAANLEQRVRAILEGNDRPLRRRPFGTVASGAVAVVFSAAILPCSLHFGAGVVQAPASGATTISTEPESIPDASCSPPVAPRRDPFAAFCCPS